MIEEILSKKYIILLEIATGNYSTLNQIAVKLGVTKQAISDYIKKMKKDGLVSVVNGYYKATNKGIEKIFSIVDDIERYINEKKNKLKIIESFSAIAGNDIKKGCKVAIFMKNGFLYAHPNKRSSCYAVSMENAMKGEDVALKDVEGIIDMGMGKIYLLMLPMPYEGGSKVANVKKIENEIKKLKFDKTAAIDIIGKIIFKKIGIKPSFEFSAINASIDAAQRGLNVLLAGGENEIRHAVSVIEDYNSSSMEKIKYRVIQKFIKK